MPNRLIQVALPLPLFQNFVYEINEDAVANRVMLGSRVLVPLRSGREVGICVGLDVQAPAKGKLKAVLGVPDVEPVVAPGMLRLCEWMSEYYAVPLGICLRSALPVALSSATALAPQRRTHRLVRLRADLPTLLQRDKAFGRAPQQRAVFELLENLGGTATVEQLRTSLEFSGSVLKGLEKRGLISIVDEEVMRDPFAARVTGRIMSHIPTEAQQAAVDAVLSARKGSVFLLHGITGSGKTLVYIEILRTLLAQGKSAIILVPEIALTPQTVDRFRGVFGDQVAVLHSALSEGERYDAWLSLQRGDRRVAVGARSAVFAPLSNLGAIVVDEEHEGTYKQNESPRYHAREVAIMRAKAEGAVILLGSATPSLESWHNAESGKYTMLKLPDRVGDGTLPEVRSVDMRVRTRELPPGARTRFHSVFSAQLEDALEENLNDQGQTILLLNRRGHASFLQCGACSSVAVCPNCSISLTYHSVPERLVCHYCQHQEANFTTCRECGGEAVRQRGVGTQQVERLLSDRFPAARIARMDVDTTGEKWAHARILDRVGSGDVDILLGTQMIAKGLDFPSVTLVGVIDADVGINLPDFRASERCFQLISQVAGRAGRGARAGRVLIQTRSPDHHAVRHALKHDYEGFMREEVAARLEPLYPPFVRLANVIFSGADEKATTAAALAGAAWLRRLLRTQGINTVELIGPAPCPVERIKTRWRWHLLLKSKVSGDLGRIIRYFAGHFSGGERGGIRVGVDRDPVSLL